MSLWTQGDDLAKLVTDIMRPEDIGVTEKMVTNILEKLGHESLLVLDGYDRLGAGDLVFPFHCDILLTKVKLSIPGNCFQLVAKLLILQRLLFL